MGRYFSGKATDREVKGFFDCMDNMINLFLSYTTSKNPEYYTSTELTRFVQYMGLTPDQARGVSRAVLSVKASLMGGNPHRLKRSEIIRFQKVLKGVGVQAFRLRVPVAVFSWVQEGYAVSRKDFLKAAGDITGGLQKIGHSFSQYHFRTNIKDLSEQGPVLSDLGIQAFPEFKKAITFLGTYKKVVLGTCGQVITPEEWPTFMSSVGVLAELGFYHKRFMGPDQRFLEVNTVQHSQYMLFRVLDALEQAIKHHPYQVLPFKDLESLARSLWMFPALSSPSFALGLKSFECFLLNRHKTTRPCPFQIQVHRGDIRVDFEDRSFYIQEGKTFATAPGESGGMSLKDIQILRTFLKGWVQSENTLRKTSTLPRMFGQPHQWLARRISLTEDGRLYFFDRKTSHTKPFLSLLNWKSHLMNFVVKAYSPQGHLDLQEWNQMMREWTPLLMSLGVSSSVSDFQENGEYLFYHGDFLTTFSNGDGRLQDTEMLELFALFASAVKNTFLSVKAWSHCRVKEFVFHSECIKNSLKGLPQKVFGSFPYLRVSLTLKDQGYRDRYLNLLDSFLPGNLLSIADLFDIFLKLHYQENAMEYLDTNRDQVLQSEELKSLLSVFEQALIDQMPFVNNREEAFAFITYVFYFGILPVMGEKQIHTPLHFGYWLLHPEKWQTIQIRRMKLLNALIQINTQL